MPTLLTALLVVATPVSKPNITNLKAEFTAFWNQAQGKSFEEQITIWAKVVESKHQGFFDSLAWNKAHHPKWKQRREKRLRELFGLYPKISPRVIAELGAFENTLAKQIARFRELFPDAKYDLPIYAAVGTTFDGKAGALENNPEQNILAFGIDVILMLRNDPDVLYAHELFHVYHLGKIGLNEKVFVEDAKMTAPLWLEGLATYVSGVINPKATDAQLLLQENLGRVSRRDIVWLASRFLSEADEKAANEKDPAIYNRWFAGSGEPVRKDLPNRTGYRLGLEVARQLAKKHDLAAMVQWRLPKIHQEVKKALQQIVAR